jgi:hypothetical protein
MRMKQGSVVALHRHTGDVHAYNLSGTRQNLRLRSSTELSQPPSRQTRENAVHQATELASRYFTAWQARDEQALSEILAEDVTFRGPLGTANGRTECIAGLMGMLGIVTAIEVEARVADDHDVITWFDLHTTAAAPAPTANWSHVEDGQINRIRVAFDPRGIVGATS